MNKAQKVSAIVKVSSEEDLSKLLPEGAKLVFVAGRKWSDEKFLNFHELKESGASFLFLIAYSPQQVVYTEFPIRAINEEENKAGMEKIYKAADTDAAWHQITDNLWEKRIQETIAQNHSGHISFAKGTPPRVQEISFRM